jgi:hypothetical protein
MTPKKNGLKSPKIGSCAYVAVDRGVILPHAPLVSFGVIYYRVVS